MGKNKLILEKILKPEINDDNSDDEDSDHQEDQDQDHQEEDQDETKYFSANDFNDDDENENENNSDIDSDEELSKQFAEGKLKPGLYGLVPMKRTTEQINDKDGLKNKLQELKLFENNWLERLDLCNDPAEISEDLKQKYGSEDLDLKLNKKGEILSSGGSSGGSVEDASQNDFKRELLFYRQAQSSCREAIQLLHQTYGIKNTQRPEDYFGEMLKSDEHMKKVHEKLQAKQTSMELSEKAKRLREQKKYSKKVQQEIQLKRQKEKRELLDKIQKYKKGKLDSLDFLENTPSNSKKSAGGDSNKKKFHQQPKVTKKRLYKESKYGYGGKKRGSKKNSIESSADFSSFSARKHGRPSSKKPKRLGKSRRQKLKNKSK